ncbi:hypothetical protein [Polaribacter sp. L3A8]|uniref:hypothetical protein n=1 Tax=Polaribacter sp. L3A8 TaxID=2686361 RepID=UPI00131D851E|nr:hypothetical protein [Polaribacter sp. L3A8]
MKISILYIMSIFLLSGTLLSGCQSKAKKVDKAKENVQEAKVDLYEIRLDTISNYEQFKIEAEKLITTQEKNIVEFKNILVSEKKEVNAEYHKKLDALEVKNKELKKNLVDYKDDGEDKWNGFKKEFNHDMNKLGKAFKDLTVENEE